jgi:hypothetical protein
LLRIDYRSLDVEISLSGSGTLQSFGARSGLRGFAADRLARRAMDLAFRNCNDDQSFRL